MSFSGNTLYNLTWTSLFEESCEVRIKQEGYGGAATRIKCSSSPIEIKCDTPSDYLLDPINGTSLTIRLIAETTFQFAELFVSDSRKFWVEYLVDSSVKFKGYILPQLHQHAYSSAPYEVKVVAADQLGLLRSITWDKNYDTTSTYGYHTPTFLEALEWIFEKTDLDLSMREGINVYEQDHDSAASDSPLDQTYFHGIAYEGKTYYDVLADILRKFSAVLRQRNGVWFIFRPIEATAAFTTRLWSWSAVNTAFTYSSNTSTNLIVLTTAASASRADLVRVGSGMFSARHAWRKYSLTSVYGVVENRILNGLFTDWTGDVPDRWSISPGISTDKAGNKLRVYGTSPRDQIRTVSQVITTMVEYWEVRFKYNVYVPSGEEMQVNFFMGASTFQKTFDNSAGDNYEESVEFTAIVDSKVLPGPPIAYTILSVYIERPFCGGGYIDIDEITAAPMKEGSSATDRVKFVEPEPEVVEINPNNLFDHGNIELITGDWGASFEGFRDTYRGALFKGFDLQFSYLPLDATKLWTSPELSNMSLVDLLKNVISTLFSDPQEMITVSIYTQNLDPCTVIQEINNSNKLYLIKQATWYPKLGKWNVEAYNIGTGVAPALLAETEVELLAEDGNVLRGD